MTPSYSSHSDSYKDKDFWIVRFFRIESALLLCTLAWLSFLFLSEGMAWDETEHCHIAWLMGALHQKPLIDFFQHHQTLLWDVLKTYFQLGGSGLGIVYFARIVLILSAAGTLLLTRIISRKISENHQNGKSHTGLLPSFTLITLAYFVMPKGYTVRPETLGLFLFYLSLFFWTYFSENKNLILFASLFSSGMSFALSCLASPRFLCLMGAFFLISKRNIPRHWIWFFSGTISMIVFYHWFFGYSFEYSLFSLQFSKFLQTIGQSPWPQKDWSWMIPTLPVLVGVQLILDPPTHSKKILQLVIHYSYLIILCFFISYTAANYHYEQNLIPLLAWIVTMVCFIQEKPLWIHNRFFKLGLFALSFSLGIGIFSHVFTKILRPHRGLFSMMKRRADLLQLLKPSDSVLLTTWKHPITAKSASFYEFPLVEYRNRLCNAIQIYTLEHSISLPPCDLTEDIIQKKPGLVDALIIDLVPVEKEKDLKRFLFKNYHWKSDLDIFIRRDLYTPFANPKSSI